MSSCVLDTDVVIAVLDRSDPHHAQAAGFLKDLIETNAQRLLSTVDCGSNISLADGFALAMARASGVSVASFDRRVQRALAGAGLELVPALRGL